MVDDCLQTPALHCHRVSISRDFCPSHCGLRRCAGDDISQLSPRPTSKQVWRLALAFGARCAGMAYTEIHRAGNPATCPDFEPGRFSSHHVLLNACVLTGHNASQVMVAHAPCSSQTFKRVQLQIKGLQLVSCVFPVTLSTKAAQTVENTHHYAVLQFPRP